MIRFLYDNLLDDGTLTASSEDSEFPVTNIQHRWHTRHWRSTGVAAEYVTCDLGAPKDIKSLIVKYHNFQLGATVHILADSAPTFDSGPGGLPELDVTLTVTTETIVYNWSSAKTYQYWRLTIADAGNPDGYVRIGRMYLGTYISPTYNYKDRQETYKDPSDKAISTGGQDSADEETHYSELSYTFLVLTADKATFKAIFDEVGTSKAYFVCEDPTSAATTTYYVQNLEDWQFSYIDPGKEWLTMSLKTMR